MYPDTTFTADQVYDVIVDFCRKNGYVPSLQDLQEIFKWRSKNSGNKAIKILVKQGKIKKDKRGMICFPSELLIS